VVSLRGLRLEGRGRAGLRCNDLWLDAARLEVVSGDQVGIEIGAGCLGRVSESWVTDNLGGGIHVETGGAFDAVNSVVARNGSPASAIGGVRAEGSFTTISLSTVVANRAAPDVACGIQTDSGDSQLIATIVYYNGCSEQVSRVTTMSSNVEGRALGPGDMDLPPMFVDLAGGDYHLRAFSPCINAVRHEVTSAGAYDIDHQPRFGVPVQLDMGADEYVSPLPP
jgi:hypothetical protein